MTGRPAGLRGRRGRRPVVRALGVVALGVALLVAALFLYRFPDVPLRAASMCLCRPDSASALVREDGLHLALTVFEWRGAHRGTVILFHGNTAMGGAHPYVRILGRRLARRGYRVIAPDFAGFGRSGDPLELGDPAALDPALDTRAVVAFAEGRGGGLRLHLVGHSRGGVPAIRAGLESEAVASVVAIGPSRRIRELMDDPSVVAEFWRREVERRRILQRGPMPAWFGPDAFAEQMRRNAWETVAADLSIPGHVPVLLLDGERESEADRRYLSRVAADMAEPGEYRTIAGADHYANVGSANLLAGGRVLLYDRRAIHGTGEVIAGWLDRWSDGDSARSDGA